MAIYFLRMFLSIYNLYAHDMVLINTKGDFMGEFDISKVGGKPTNSTPNVQVDVNKIDDKKAVNEKILKYFGKKDGNISHFPTYRASQEELNKLSANERKQYEELFNYTNSKSHGMDPQKDAAIKEWNKNHPNCKIKSQYDDVKKLQQVIAAFNPGKADEAVLNKLTAGDRKLYDDLYHYTNSKSHGMDPQKNAQIKEWNANHPDCQIKSQYDVKW